MCGSRTWSPRSLSTPHAAGIYWGNGTLVHEPQAFRAQADGLTVEHLVPQLWIDMARSETATAATASSPRACTPSRNWRSKSNARPSVPNRCSI